MAELTGEIAIHLDALGEAVDDPRVVRAVAALGGRAVVSEFDDGAPARYLAFETAGAEILVEQDVVAAIFFHLRGEPPMAAFSRVGELIPGLEASSTREDVRAAFGEPFRSAAAYDLFRVGERFAHFEYDGPELVRITLMAGDPLA